MVEIRKKITDLISEELSLEVGAVVDGKVYAFKDRFTLSVLQLDQHPLN